MGMYETTSKKTATSTEEPKLFPGKDDNFTLSWLESRWLEMDGSRDDADWDLRMVQEESRTLWNEDGSANVNLPIERAQARLKEGDETAQKPNIKFLPTEQDDVAKVEITEEYGERVIQMKSLRSFGSVSVFLARPCGRSS